jgi:CRISPR system Cascade subunit CasB
MSQPAAGSLDQGSVVRARDRRFVAALERLVPRAEPGREQRGDRAALAALRRAAGKPPGSVPDAYPAVYRALGEEALPPWEEEPYFIVASLFALYPEGSWPSDAASGARNLGASFARLAERTASGSIEQRFQALLDSHREALVEHLRHAVSLCRAHGVPVDWVELLDDVRHWESDSRRVQRKWARTFWGEVARLEVQAAMAADTPGAGDLAS